jgi:hypothetical protein
MPRRSTLCGFASVKGGDPRVQFSVLGDDVVVIAERGDSIEIFDIQFGRIAQQVFIPAVC